VNLSRAVLGTLLALAMVGSVVAPAVVAAPEDRYTYTGDTQMPETVMAGNVTKDVHRMEWSSPLTYEADNGDIEMLTAEVNKTSSPDSRHLNPFEFNATEINESAYGEFPRKSEEVGDNDASALDASEWWTNSTSTGSSASVSDVTTAPNVDAVELSASSVDGSNPAYFEYANFSITSDADKRYLQAALDVSSLGSSSSEVTLMANDTDGDYVEIYLVNQSNNETDFDTAANASTEGHVIQEQVGNLTVHGSGDGSMGEIDHLNVSVTGDDATVRIAALNAEKMSEWSFGQHREDTDGDDTLETSTVREPHGTFTIHDLDTMGSTFDDSRIRDLTFPFVQHARDLPDSQADIQLNASNKYPSLDFVGNIQYKHRVPDAYDLSYSDLELRITADWPSSRYKVENYEEEVGNTDFGNISYSGSFSISNEDERVVIDSTITPGDYDAVQLKAAFTAEEKQTLATPSSGGGGAPVEGEDGGFGVVDLLMEPLTWLAALFTGALGKARGVF
jgi:hypothetical protein